MEVQLLKEKLTNAVLSLYMYFLKILGFNVTYENRGGKMRGGALLDETVYAIYFAFFFIIVISNIFPPDSKELGEALDLAVSGPEQLVEKLIAENPDEINKTQQLIEDFGLESSEYLVSKIEGNITTSVNRLLKDKNSEKAIVDVMTGVAANAMSTITQNEIELNFEDTYGPNTGKYLRQYLHHLTLKNPSSVTRFNPLHKPRRLRTLTDQPVQEEEGPVGISPEEWKEGGAKKRRQKSKRRRGGSKKQKRRSHKRK